MQSGIIYDFGMNNGDDIEYYLLKSSKVVGVEANPTLCREAEARFKAEIADGRLVLLNIVLSPAGDGRPVGFYVHKANHVLSQMEPPAPEAIHEFERFEVVARAPSDIVREHGEPRFVKIDLEGMDAMVLRNLFAAGIHPPEISAESHSVEVFTCLVEAGYKAFNLVNGWSVSEAYGHASIQTLEGLRSFGFKPHSAGPFGIDIRSEWQDPQTFFYTLAAAGLGWKDIHASDLITPAPPPPFRKRIRRQAIALARQIVRGIRSGLTRSHRLRRSESKQRQTVR